MNITSRMALLHDGVVCDHQEFSPGRTVRRIGMYPSKVSSCCYIFLKPYGKCRYWGTLRDGEGSRNHGMAELGTAWRVTLWVAEDTKMAPPGGAGVGGRGDFEGRFAGLKSVGSADCCIVEYGQNNLSKPFAQLLHLQYCSR